jgi:hypothetical protein
MKPEDKIDDPKNRPWILKSYKMPTIIKIRNEILQKTIKT